jgi:hypothetical protein
MSALWSIVAIWLGIDVVFVALLVRRAYSK